MKPVPALLLVVALSCNNDHSASPTNDIKDAVTAVMNDYHRGLLDKNAPLMFSTLDDNGIFLGTDPEEFLTKKQLAEYVKPSFSDSTKFEPYTVVRDVRPGPENKSAIVIEQYVFKVISPGIPIRGIGYLVLRDGKWLINMYSLALIPRNEDLPVINEVVRSHPN